MCDSMHINEQEIIDKLSILPVNNAIDADLISHKMLKATKLTIFKPLFLLFIRSLREYVFPIMCKQANIIPLFKKDDPSILSNYRPVSLLSCVGNVMVRIVFKHLDNYFHSNKIFYKYQAGFLPGHSTVFHY